MSSPSRKQQLEAMLAEEPNDAFLRYALAMEYASAGQDEEAARRFLELIELAPLYVPTYLTTARTLLRLGQDEEARGILHRGIPIARQQGEGHAAEEMEGFLASIA